MRYRSYFLDHGKNISGALDCETAEDACAIAQRDVNGRRIGIWHAGRRMGVFKANIDFCSCAGNLGGASTASIPMKSIA